MTSMDTKRAQHRARAARQVREDRRPCLTCGQTTRALDQVCRSCRRIEAQAEADLELRGGQWVPNGRGVLTWREDEVA